MNNLRLKLFSTPYLRSRGESGGASSQKRKDNGLHHGLLVGFIGSFQTSRDLDFVVHFFPTDAGVEIYVREDLVLVT